MLVVGRLNRTGQHEKVTNRSAAFAGATEAFKALIDGRCVVIAQLLPLLNGVEGVEIAPIAYPEIRAA